MVVVAIIGILAGLVFPAVLNARHSVWIASCLGGKRQLGIACQVYATDYRGQLPLNGIQPLKSVPNWCHIRAFWSIGGDEQTNDIYMIGEKELLAPYLGRTTTPFKCPADIYYSPIQRPFGKLYRKISISMNPLMGDGLETDNIFHKYDYPSVVTYRTQDDFKKLSPADVWNITDVHPDNNPTPYFHITPELDANIKVAFWANLPSSLHRGGATIVFADGHAINHRWIVAGTRQPVRYQGWNSIENPQSDVRDYRWMVTHTTEAK